MSEVRQLTGAMLNQTHSEARRFTASLFSFLRDAGPSSKAKCGNWGLGDQSPLRVLPLLGQMDARPLCALRGLDITSGPGLHPTLCPQHSARHTLTTAQACGGRQGQSCTLEAGCLVPWCCRRFEDTKVNKPYTNEQAGDENHISWHFVHTHYSSPALGCLLLQDLAWFIPAPTPSQLPPSPFLK